MMIDKEQIFIPGPAGKLETILTPPADSLSKKIVIICHPHPLYGGTMNNKVVTTLARTFYEMEMWTVCFNFRGIGKSEGSYGEAIGEIDDLRAILAWVREKFGDFAIWLAGFSFGSHIAAQVAAHDHDIQQLISIAPPVNHFNFHNTNTIACPWLVVVAEEDEVVPLNEIKLWLEKNTVPVQTIFFPETSHFFHGKLGELREVLKAAFLKPSSRAKCI